MSSVTTSPLATRQLRTRMQERLLLAIFVGGAIGAVARAGLVEAFPVTGHGWPWATFLVNIVGAALLGYFVTRLQERLPPSTYPRPLVGTGLCGALTTFSTLQVEVIELVRNEHALLGVSYMAVSVTAGLLVVYLTTVSVRRITAR
jgi:fluoride exporter